MENSNTLLGQIVSLVEKGRILTLADIQKTFPKDMAPAVRGHVEAAVKDGTIRCTLRSPT